MAFMLGSFTEGMFGGAKAMLQMYGMYQGLQQTQNTMDAAAAYKEQATNQQTLDLQTANDDAAARQQGYATGSADTDADPNNPNRVTDPRVAKSAQEAADAHHAPIDLGKLPGANEPKTEPALPVPPIPPGETAQPPVMTTAQSQQAQLDAPGSPPPSARTTPNDASGEGRDEYGRPLYQLTTPALPTTGQPTYAAPNDPGRAYQQQATRPQPGTDSDVAAHGALDTSAPVMPPRDGAYPGEPGLRYQQQATQPQPGTDSDVAAHGEPWSPTRPSYQPSLPGSPTVPRMQRDVSPPAPSTGGGLGGRILSMINPVGSAHAAEATPQTAPAPAPPASEPGVTRYGSVEAANAALGGGDSPAAKQALQTSAAPPTTQGTTAPVQAGPAVVKPTPGDSGKVAPGQTQPSVQSETVAPRTPTFDTRPYAALEHQRPSEQKALIDKIAGDYGVSPQRIALHWYIESRMKMSSPDSPQNAVGVMQVLPGTAREVDPKGTIGDPRSFEGSMRLGALYIAKMDGLFGKDTPSSIMAYHQGPANVPGFMSALKDGSANASHPKGLDYLQQAYPNEKNTAALGLASTTASTMTPQGIIQAAAGGPDGVLRYAEQTTSPNMTMQDKWRSVEIAMVSAQLARGDIVGAQHARDFVMQQSQQGAAGYLMHAHQALSAGDGVGAATYLARAYAFFPDGATSRFGVDAKGQVWGRRFDEHDQSKPIGPHFQVTPDNLAPMLIQTKDPQQYLKLVTDHQKAVAQTRYQDAHSDYLRGALDVQREGHALTAETSRQNNENTNQTRRDNAQAQADAKVEAARLRAEQQGGQNAKQVAAETSKAFGPDAVLPTEFLTDTPGGPALRARAATIMGNLRAQAHLNDIQPETAAHIAQNLATGTYRVGKTLNEKGERPVIDSANKTIVYLPPHIYQQLMTVPGFEGAPTPGPVGSRAGTTGALQTGAPTGSLSPGPSSALPPQNAPTTRALQ